MIPPSHPRANPALSESAGQKKQGNTALNDRQAEAVRHKEGPLLIAAGAGSGKTKTLTSRLLALLERGIPGEEIIAITFTNKAAEEMRQRVVGNVQNVEVAKSKKEDWRNNYNNYNSYNTSLRLPFIGTFHSLGARILRNHAAAFGRTPGYSIYDNDDSRRVVKQLTKNSFSALAKELGPAPLGKEFARIKNECLIPALPASFRREANKPEIDPELLALFLVYEERLRAQNAFDFDDLIEKPVELLIGNPDLRARYERRFRNVLVDEYQDINTTQYAFIRLLTEHHGNICVVGDDNQAIYSFRGADFRNFLNFERDFPNARVVLLEENYRSSANIIRAASEVVSNNTLQKPKRLWTRNSEGILIRVFEAEGPEEEAEKIAEFAAPNPAATAILYRTNAQSRAIEQALLAADIPYVIFGGLRFYDRKEIKDLVSALRYAQNPKDAVALDRLDKAFLKADFRRLRDELPSHTPPTGEGGTVGAGGLAPAPTPNAKHLVWGPAELLGYILKETGYLASLRKNFQNAEERIQNIRELIAFSLDSGTLSNFIERISLLQGDEGPNRDHTGAVRIMTIHLSKGLEFDRVIVAGVAEGLLPHQMSLSTLSEIEEERRLMYVAMTRAKKELALTFYGVGSRFLYEIPQELVEFTSTVGPNHTFTDDEERYILRE
ncbi:MAG: UvrD-helicase domain-containing protein [bacterium]|nr:UvrD-helicase domain-containing protein [bacterium]